MYPYGVHLTTTGISPTFICCGRYFEQLPIYPNANPVLLILEQSPFGQYSVLSVYLPTSLQQLLLLTSLSDRCLRTLLSSHKLCFAALHTTPRGVECLFTFQRNALEKRKLTSRTEIRTLYRRPHMSVTILTALSPFWSSVYDSAIIYENPELVSYFPKVEVALWIYLTLILRRSRTGTVWFYTSTSNKKAARPKLYTK